jgi:hypothetical protein
MKIDVLYFTGCPNHVPTVERVRELANRLEVNVELNQIEVTANDDPVALKFLGSPTVLVNGYDVDPTHRIGAAYGFGCRTFGGVGVPPKEMIERAIAEARGRDQHHAMQCLEVWGGNKAVETSLSVPGIDAWVSSIPYQGDADGGDVHYLSMCGAGRISRFTVADVAGHGTSAGELGQLLRKLMRKHIRTLDQTVFARTLNDGFSHLAKDGHFATAVLATYFAPTDHLIICNLGHPRPLWYRSETATWVALDHVFSEPLPELHNLPLGIIEGTQYMQFAVKLGEHDMVLLFTDSLIEACNPEGRMLNEAGLLALVQRLPAGSPATIGRSILESVAAYRGARPPNDDETLLVLHHNAMNPPAQSLGEKLRVMARMLGLDLRH